MDFVPEMVDFILEEDFILKLMDLQVSWDEFDKWWAERSGDEEPSCPVLPEGMIKKLEEMTGGDGEFDSGWVSGNDGFCINNEELCIKKRNCCIFKC